MQALILVGGLGTRLRQVVSDRPKPMAPVSNKPFLEYLISNLKLHGINNIILAVGYMGTMIEDYFRDGSSLEVNIKYSYEREQLGTAGAIKNAESLINEENIVVLNGDTFFNIDYKALVEFNNIKNSKFTMVLRTICDSKRYGTVDIDNNNKILKFTEKDDKCKSNIINAGIYIIHRSILEYIPNNEKYSLENNLMKDLLKDNIDIYGKVMDGYFIDIGIPEDYYKFVNNVKSGVVKC